MLSKPIYEFVPYACLSVGGVSVISVDSALGIVAGVGLYTLGALVWMMRFHSRHPVKRNFSRRGYILPEEIYEFKPFLFLAGSLLLFSFYTSAWAIGVGLAIVAHSLYILFKRYQNRTCVGA
ncbi:MAG: hypothetical protein ACJAT7_001314 [Psychromonas sp.]|jgi:hypothetical protein|uniref:hypothetical protein n=1 Tax=Psychromonas sp. TaxID=1884585 RepID=UPI0039E522CB